MINMPVSGIDNTADKLDSFGLSAISPDNWYNFDGRCMNEGTPEDLEMMKKVSAEDFSPSIAETYPDNYPFTTSYSGFAVLGTTTDVTAGTPQLSALETVPTSAYETTMEIIPTSTAFDTTPELTPLEPAMATEEVMDDGFLSGNLQFVCQTSTMPTSRNIPAQAQNSVTQIPTSASFILTSAAASVHAPQASVAASISADSSGHFAPKQAIDIQLPKDEKMAEAVRTTLKTGSIMPLIKEELKYTIQSRRLAAGKPELQVEFKPPKREKGPMTPEERVRADKRREQNRKAAQKFRQKQRDTAEVLTRKTQKLEGANTTLRAEIKRLAREKNELRKLLQAHLAVCPKVKAGLIKVKIER